MNNFLFYNRLIFLDLGRLWKSVQHQVIIISGICLPILLLMGLSNGHVDELRKDLVESPTGRRLAFYSTVGAKALSQTVLDEIASEIPKVELLIPELTRNVTILNKSSGEQIQDISLYTTEAGDPEFSKYGITIPSDANTPAIILNQPDAKKLGTDIGGIVEIQVTRSVGESEFETAKTDFMVVGLTNRSLENTQVAYTTVKTMYRLEQYVNGYSIPEFDWPAISKSPVDQYSSYLIITELDDPLTSRDIQRMDDRDLVIRPASIVEIDLLNSVIIEEEVRNLKFYFVKNKYDELMRMAPGAIMRFTGCSDVVMAWNSPIETTISNVKTFVCSLTSPTDVNWFTTEYLLDPSLAFYPEQAYEYATKSARSIAGLKTIPLLDHEIPVSSNIQNVNIKPNYVMVPAPMLAHMTSVLKGDAEFDRTSGIFVKKRVSLLFNKARLYVETIDDVPETAKQLAAMGYAIMSEEGLIREIQEQAKSLNLLVIVVGIGVFVFGIITVFSVLSDSTERKRGTIGILRVMGVSKIGIFYFVCLRAICIGMLSGIFTIGLAIMSASSVNNYLNMRPTAFDYFLVFAGGLLISGLGSVLPAIKASRMDPYDAVIEGRFV